ncbi:hypothetical protein H310_03367 [Aphanomyces invadans]|uniref:FYVE-type domain-containing protein n=1 Tax=Aphanomyces invadans TaxID=157072 RepID=A0A024UID9_9STRA|nr:hypothetical protein H310_03367 [Aphanomyces invadans]ETW05642.1 hypothetical protein H310_03367 [Aphanomyces invadans]|eukprot:XP_008865419.1 hypothetical protein H310_03367 [Aphanomyces invadans]
MGTCCGCAKRFHAFRWSHACRFCFQQVCSKCSTITSTVQRGAKAKTAKRMCLACVTAATTICHQGATPRSVMFDKMTHDDAAASAVSPAMLTCPRTSPPSHLDLTALAPRFQHDATYFLLLEQAMSAMDATMGLIQLIGSRGVVVVTSYNFEDVPPNFTRVDAGLVTLQSTPSVVRERYHDGLPFVRIPLLLASACIGTMEVECPTGQLPCTDTLKELEDIASTTSMVMQNTAIELSTQQAKRLPSGFRMHRRGNSISTTSSTSSMYSTRSYNTIGNLDTTSTSQSKACDVAEEMMEALLAMSKHTAKLIQDTKDRRKLH